MVVITANTGSEMNKAYVVWGFKLDTLSKLVADTIIQRLRTAAASKCFFFSLLAIHLHYSDKQLIGSSD